jgi:hypothetical protein
MRLPDNAYRLMSLVVIFSKWAWAKLHGRDYNAGMDA